MIQRLDDLAIKTRVGMVKLMEDEQGDTSFISLIIILGLVVTLAGVFIGFKDTIINAAKAAIDKGVNY